MKETSEVLKNWFEKAVEMPPGNEIFIPCEDKRAGNSLKTRFYRVRDKYKEVDPIMAESISFSSVRRFDLNYLLISKSPAREITSGFMKAKDGTKTKINITIDTERKRTLLRMIQDKLSFTEIEEQMGELTGNELALTRGLER